MSEPRVVLYTSYPKTGSTFLPSLVERLRDACPGYQVEQFTFAKSRNNLKASLPDGSTVYLMKTHHVVSEFFRRAKADPRMEDVTLKDFMESGERALATPGNGLVYTMRNPFATLASAITYSKLVYAREGNAESWLRDGRADNYFMGFLGMRAIPDVATFKDFKFLELPDNQIEDVCWRYVESRGSIPFLDGEGGASYFEHVNFHQRHLDELPNRCLLTYERLMGGVQETFAGVAGVLGLPTDDLFKALGAETADREERSGRYTSSFFANFQVSTPPRVLGLGSWRQIRDYTLELCPPLAITLTETSD
jgi:hypothetical protein